MLRLTLAQLNPTVGDIEGNVSKVIAIAEQVAKQTSGSDYPQLIVFPELTLTGYYPGDLLDEPHFLTRVQAGLERLHQASSALPALHLVVGTPLPHEGPGKTLCNSLVVLSGGKTLLRYAKQLLPTYNVFDERRHFAPGPDVARVLRIGDVRVGFLICEDGWNDDGSDYAINPFERLSDAAPDLVVSINASPSSVGVREQRHRLFGAACRRHFLPMVYVNQVGGQDSLVYDGASFAVDPRQGIVFEAQRFVEDSPSLIFEAAYGANECGRFSTVDGQPCVSLSSEELSPYAFYRAQIQLGLKDYARRCGFTRAVVGSSGGIDSALTIALAASALGPENVVAITMPSRFSSAGSVGDSESLCRTLGVPLLTHSIAELVEGYRVQFEASFGRPLQGIPLENLQARIRGTILMEYSNAFGHLLLTTGNKSEISVGYCTLYGDTNGGLGLLGDLYKTEVYGLSRFINEEAGNELIPQAIIDKEPSAELAPEQKDSDSLPPYGVLDDVLKVLLEGRRLAPWERAIADSTVARLCEEPAGRELLAKVRQMIARNEYKRRQAPPIIRVRSRAFGSGRQMPIAALIHPNGGAWS